MPETTQVRSVTVGLKANFTSYDTATARSAAATKKATGEMAAAAKSAATQVDAAAKKMSAAQERAAKSVEKSAQAAERAATREASAAQRAAAREETAARKSTAAVEREAARKAAAQERSAARQEATVRRLAAAETAAYREQAARAKSAEQAARRAADERHRAMSDLGTTIGMTSAAVLAASAVAVKGFADFESQMSRVGAAMDADAESMDRLKTAALEAGKATKYSATEAARAEEELGKAGLTVAEIVGGGLAASMDLAAAGGMELADSAEIAATTMKTFALEASEVPAVADALAAGAGKAVGSVQEMGFALKMSGLVANQLGLSMTDTVGTLAAFAQNALLGSDAGTSFKTMLSFLQPKSAEAASTMKELGLDFFDAQGEFIGITATAGQLQEKLGALTQEQRMATMYTIFGSDAIRAANILYREGETGIRKWISAVEDQGYAARVAAKAQENLKGDIEKLGGAIETALIQSGGGGAAGLRTLTQEATKAVDVFASLPAPVGNTLTAVGLVAGAAGLAAAGFLKVVPAIAEFKAATNSLNMSMATSRARLGAVAGFLAGPWGVALAAGTVAFGVWAEKQASAAAHVRDLTGSLDEQTGAITRNTRELAVKALEDQGLGKTSTYLKLSFKDVTDAALGNAAALARLEAQHRANTDAMSHHTDAYAQSEIAWAVLRKAITGETGNLAESREAWKRHTEAMGETADGTAAAATAAGGAAAAMDGVGESAGGATAEAEAYAAAMESGEQAAQAEAEALGRLKEALDATNNLFLAGRDASRGYEAALDAAAAAAKKNGKGLDEGTEKGRENAEALDAVAEAGMAHLQNLVDQEVPQRKFNMAMAETRADLIRVAEKFGMSKTAAEKYADKIYKIPAKRATEIYLKNAEKAKRQAEELYNKVRSMPANKTITLTVREVYENYGGEDAARARYTRAGLFERAEGGQIPASAGVPGRDSVPALLMPEEYVVRASQARAHLPLLEAINAGRLPGYATGGQVGARPAPVSSTAPQVVMVPVSETHTTAATVHVGTVVTGDAGSFVDWGRRRSFDATGGVH